MRGLPLALLLLSLPAQRAPAQAPGSELTIYLMTMGPGDEAWEKFGHNAIWVHDTVTHTDIAYNWGLFDFNAKDFYSRFLRGDMLYSMGGFDTASTLEVYREANRSVWVQELVLNPQQRDSLRKFVLWNALPENRNYNYDYFRDNCSTRVRDVIDRILGGALRRASDSVATGTTYRSHTRRLTEDTPWLYAGTLLGLGHPVDRPISEWEEMFLPVRLMNDIRAVRVPDSTGTMVPLVKSEMQLVKATRPPEPTEASSHLAVFLVLGCFLGGLAVLLRYFADGGRNGARVGLLIFSGVWNLIVGILGTGLAGLWLFTRHIYSYDNENLFQANLLSLILALLILFSFRKRADGVVSPFTEKLAWAVAALAVLGFLAQILPSFNQVNGEIIALLLPVHLGIALALSRYSVLRKPLFVARQISPA